MHDKTATQSSEPALARNCQHCIQPGQDMQHLLGNKRIALLAGIERDPAIMRAAAAAQLSYTAAVAELDAMNNLASRPLLIHTLGNVQDGRAYLTEHGRRAVRLHTLLHAAQHDFQRRIAAEFPDFGQLGDLLQALTMKSSARNQLRGAIKEIRRGPVNADVLLDLGDGMELCANMTCDTVLELGLHPGRTATALIKPSFVLLSIDEQIRISTRNRFAGIVSGITHGMVNCEVKLQLPGGRSLVAAITRDALDELDLGEGSECWAFITAAHVLLAVHDGCPAHPWLV